MGIKQYFITTWRRFPNCIHAIQPEQNLTEITGINIDNLLIDSNGIIHTAAQKVFKYGNYKQEPERCRLMGKGGSKISLPIVEAVRYTQETRIKVYQLVVLEIERLVELTHPKKSIVICIDGPAPFSKQNQQRQRRFRAAMERTSCRFDSNAITPGTQFMDGLSSYMDNWIRNKIKTDWKTLNIIFSNEKVPGEGEAKILQYVRTFGNPKESYCIIGADADLIMLSLASHIDRFYVFREDMSNGSEDMLLVDIPQLRNELIQIMKWDSKKSKYMCDPRSLINDYVFMCFLCGNDFVPHIPSIEIIEGGIEFFLRIYREIGPIFGHITSTTEKNGVLFKPSVLREFLVRVANEEKNNFEKKRNNGVNYFEDTLMDKHTFQNSNNRFEVDIESYRREYSDIVFSEFKGAKVCHQYLEGLQWVLWYYTRGVPHWKWYYPHHYAPMASSIIEHINTFITPHYTHSDPAEPLHQLVCVLPPKSSGLLPRPLGDLLHSSDFENFCPAIVDIDLAGKRREWEGVVLTPPLNQDIIDTKYQQIMNSGVISSRDLKRNKNGITFGYKFNTWKSNDKAIVIEYIDLYGNVKKKKV